MSGKWSEKSSEELSQQLFVRQDESADEDFYVQPRFCTHIDDATIDNLTHYYREAIPAQGKVLDLMSSWISHLPDDQRYGAVSGLGMNLEELAANKRLDDYCLQNLNQNPILPYPSECFDAVLIAVSVQYLIRSQEVFNEIFRCLTSGGKCIVGMSHRLFPTKAIYAFHVLPPADRCRLVSGFMQKAGMVNVQVIDRSPANADPLWIVVGEK
tara:strand:+ start:877 stop:1512 length:636 start_codon:yes stop_codon:yes gene_type:complete